MLLTENSQKWSNIIAEELGVKDQNKLSWMSKYAQNHEVYEAVQAGDPAAGIYATPLNTLGMGNPMMPTGVGYTQGAGIGNTGADFHNPNYKVGSGDIPMSTLTMSLEVAAMTIGLELVPVIPMNGPWAMLSYMDFPYAGGKLGRLNETVLDGKGEGNSNKPIYIKVPYTIVYAEGKSKKDIPAGVQMTFENKDGQRLVGKFIGFSRIDNSIIVEVVECQDKDGKMSADLSIADVFASPVSLWKIADVTNIPADGVGAQQVTADLVSGAADHVQGFANFATGSADLMSRAENETGVGNTIGARMFTKLVQAGAYEVTGTVTRQQLQDMPLYGVDVIGKVLEAMQNEISQSINNRILDRLFKLGVTNAKVQKEYQGVDLNLFFGTTADATRALKDFAGAKKFVDIHGNNAAENWGLIPNATKNTAAENVYTHQRRVMSRVLAAANVITNVSRFGRPNFVVTSTKILTALQDCAGFVVAPMANTLVQDGSNSLYFAGSVAGLNVYVDPYMTWDDTRVLVGRKGDGNTPGVVFMPYILADTVQTIVEGTMAPKLLVNSRFAIVDAGFHPEQQYLTFMVDSDGDFIL
jgi:ribosome-binding factor A